MKTGDVVMFYDLSCSVPPQHVLIIETGIECATNFGTLEEFPMEAALILNELGTNWVPMDDLGVID